MWLYPYITRKPLHRDYEEIKKEGVLRIVTEYNSSGYYIKEIPLRAFNTN